MNPAIKITSGINWGMSSELNSTPLLCETAGREDAVNPTLNSNIKGEKRFSGDQYILFLLHTLSISYLLDNSQIKLPVSAMI